VSRLGFSWDEKRVERLEKLIHEGLDCSTVARRFGCSPTTIQAKVREISRRRELERQQREAEAA
jgi:hypothetical protein